MVTAGDFRNGMTIQMDGSIWQVIEFQHVRLSWIITFTRLSSFSMLSQVRDHHSLELSLRILSMAVLLRIHTTLLLSLI